VQAALPTDPALQQQLQAAMAGAGGGAGPQGMPTQQDAMAAQEKKKAEEEMREDLLTRLLAPDAKERIARLSLVKPDKARKLGDMVIQMGRGGRMQQPLSDTQLKNMLEKISEGATSKVGDIQLDRRRYANDDSDSDIDLSDL